MKTCTSMFILGLLAGTVVTRAAGLETWHLRPSPVTAALHAVCYGNGQFVAVGGGGTILSSPDGGTWVSRVSGTPQTLRGVVFAQNSFVAVGENQTTLTSSNGVDWAVNLVPPLDIKPQPPLLAVTYGNGVFVASGSVAYTSADGVNWSPPHYYNAAGGSVGTMSYGNGVFAGFNEFLSGGAYMVTSSDAAVWRARLWGQFIMLRSITFGAGRFVAVGGWNDDVRPWNAYMATSVSTNAIDWTPKNVIGETGHYLHHVTYGGGLFFALGSGRGGTNTSDVFATSVDGFSWSIGNLPSSAVFNAPVFGADTFVVVGYNGTILQSDPFPATPALTEARFAGITLGSPVSINITGPPGKAFRVEYADDLSTNQLWHDFGQSIFTDAAATLYDTNAPAGSQRFYRTIVIP